MWVASPRRRSRRSRSWHRCCQLVTTVAPRWSAVAAVGAIAAVTLTAPSIVTVPAGTVEIVVGRDEIIVVVGRVVPIPVVPIDLRIVGVEVLVLRGGVVQHGL